MPRIQIPSGDSPNLQINNIGGSLQVKSWSEDSIRIEVQHEENLDYSFEDNTLSLSCSSDCLLRVPEESTATTIESVGGDAFVASVEGEVHVQRVGGSLTLKSVGPATLGRISGNLTARNVEGELIVSEVSGNVSLRDIEGDVTANKVSANLSLRNVEGNIEAKSGGNADLRLDLEENYECRVKAGGNLFCHLESSADADVVLVSGAQQIHIYTDESNQVLQTGKHEFTLGQGGAIVELAAGGHIDFRCRDMDDELLPDMDFVDDLTGLADEITGQVTAQMGDQIEALNEKLQVLSERLKQSGSQAGARAQRRVEAAQRRLERKLQGRGIRSHGRTVTFTRGGKGAEPVSSKERGLILQMVQEKKINVDEAEMLLNTLEGRIAPISPIPPVSPVAPVPPNPPVPPVEPKDKED